MTGPRVLVTSIFLKPGGDVDRRLREEGIEPVFNNWYPGRTEGELVSAIQGMDGCVIAGDRLTARVIQSADRLKIIARTGVGYDGVDLPAATARGIVVCNTPGVNRHAVSEYTMALVLTCARHLMQNLTEISRGGWTRAEGRDLAGSTIGIVGLGTIGKEVAQRARAFEMRVLAFDVCQDIQFAEEHQVAFVALDELLRDSDYVSLNLNLDATSHHLINAERLALMKPTAYLINTARGGVVDSQALYHALKAKQIAGAALDVFEEEPLSANHPLRELDNLYMSPHAGGVTSDARRLSGMGAAENVIRFFKGQRSLPIVNPEVWDRAE